MFIHYQLGNFPKDCYPEGSHSVDWHFKLYPRVARILCTIWMAQGWLIAQVPVARIQLVLRQKSSLLDPPNLIDLWIRFPQDGARPCLLAYSNNNFVPIPESFVFSQIKLLHVNIYFSRDHTSAFVHLSRESVGGRGLITYNQCFVMLECILTM